MQPGAPHGRGDATLAPFPLTAQLPPIDVLYEAHGNQCYRLAHWIVREPHLAKDVVQEAFLAAWTTRDSFDPSRGTVRAWLLSLTHHKAVDIVRRNARHSSRAANPSALEFVVARDDVATEAWISARHAYVVSALAQLSVAQRNVLEQAYFGGRTQSEIARDTGIPLGTVKTRTLVALRHLRANLELRAIAADEGWRAAATSAQTTDPV